MFLIIIFNIFIHHTYAGEPKSYFSNPSVPQGNKLDLQGQLNPSLFTGSATYSYGIRIPPGTSNLQPSLGLVYNSQATKQSEILGNAWSITQNNIQRDVNYTNINTSDDTFTLTLNGASYDLIYVLNEDRFHTKIETYMYVENKTSGNNEKDSYWLVRTKDGTAYRFGYNNDSELVSDLTNLAVRWSLDLINDTHSNKIYYSYKEDPYSNDYGTVYPEKIEYNNDKRRAVHFALETTGRADITEQVEVFINSTKR